MNFHGKVLILSAHSATRYTGGRYHSWLMAEALAAAGFAVTVITNEPPLVAKEFVDYPQHNDITLVLNSDYNGWQKQDWDYIVLVPDLKPDPVIFLAALKVKTHTGAPIVFLDFEAPSWFNMRSTSKRRWYRTLWWWLAARHANVILSTTDVGRKHARNYYEPENGDASFQQCYAAINDAALPSVSEISRSNRVVCISRHDKGTQHKGTGVIKDLIQWLPTGFTVSCIGVFDDQFCDEMNGLAAKTGVSIEFLTKLSDKEKFEVIATSRLMVFASKFEGYGLPPIEAACAGTPCVAVWLDVLQETLGFGTTTFVKPGDIDGLRQAILSAVQSTDKALPDHLRTKALQAFSFATYRRNLSDIFARVPVPKQSALHAVERHIAIASMTVTSKLARLTYMFLR